jgi:hypothetical protein
MFQHQRHFRAKNHVAAFRSLTGGRLISLPNMGVSRSMEFSGAPRHINVAHFPRSELSSKSSHQLKSKKLHPPVRIVGDQVKLIQPKPLRLDCLPLYSYSFKTDYEIPIGEIRAKSCQNCYYGMEKDEKTFQEQGTWGFFNPDILNSDFSARKLLTCTRGQSKY